MSDVFNLRVSLPGIQLTASAANEGWYCCGCLAPVFAHGSTAVFCHQRATTAKTEGCMYDDIEYDARCPLCHPHIREERARMAGRNLWS